MHAEGQLVLLDARVRFRIADELVIHLVQLLQAVERAATDFGRHAIGIADEQDRIAGRTERNARMFTRQIAASPEPGGNGLLLLPVRRYGDKHDECWQIFVERAEPIGCPGAQARFAGDLVARLHVRDRRLMVDRVGVHAADEAHVVDHLGRVRQQFADPHPALAVLSEFVFRRGDRKPGLARGHAGEPLAVANRIRQILIEKILHLRLVVVQVHLRRSADHVQIDDVLRLRGEVRQVFLDVLNGRFRRTEQLLGTQQRRQRGEPDGAGSAAKELPSRFSSHPFLKGIHDFQLSGVGGQGSGCWSSAFRLPQHAKA